MPVGGQQGHPGPVDEGGDTSSGATASTMPLFLNLEEVEGLARGVLPKMAFDYYSGGSDTGYSVRENRRAWQDFQLVPRMLVDVSRVDLSTTLYGMCMAAPIMVAPMAMHGLAHADREVATCRAAGAMGIPFVFSTVATSSLEEVAATQHGAIIFQLYVVRDREVVRRWVAEAEARGFKALMVTVDAQRLGRREADERNHFTLPPGLRLKNLESLSSGQVTQARDSAGGSGLMKLFAAQVDDSLTWDFLPWLRSITRLPVLVKGVLCAEDARLALAHGAAGLVVSNHGGRQMDYAPAPLSVLAEVVEAVGGRVPVLMDGGVRRGTDVLKALALGASAVLVGRPVLYGLALGGQAGVERVLGLLVAELELAMALAGCARLGSIGPHLLRRVGGAAASVQQLPGGAAAGCCCCSSRCSVGEEGRSAAGGQGGGRGCCGGAAAAAAASCCCQQPAKALLQARL